MVRVKLVSSPQHFRGNADAFKQIWMSSSSATILFNGASKRNPGSSGAKGVVFSPNRLIESTFSWGLGIMSNNQSECYIPFMPCQIAKEKG